MPSSMAHAPRRLAAIGALLLVALAGCGGGPTRLEATPPDAVMQVEKYLTTYGLTFDPAGRVVNAQGGRARTQWYCHRDRTDPRSGPSLDALFNRASPGPIPFERESTLPEQRPELVDCPWIFRVDVMVRPAPEAGASLLEPEEAWYRAELGACVPVGEPLLGIVRCQWRYSGGRGPGNAAGWVQSILSGLGPFTRNAGQEAAVPTFSPTD